MTVACQAPLSMEFSRQEYWSGLPFLPPGDLLNPGGKPTSPAWQADSLPPSHQESPHTWLMWTAQWQKVMGEIMAGEFHMDVHLPS